MNLKIKELASIQMGYSFRSSVEMLETGTTSVIQMKDLMANNLVDCSNLMRVDIEKLKEHHLVKSGDLIFRSRGQVMTSALLTEDPGDAVLAAPLLRIRITTECILPEYLNWFISQTPAQAFLISCAEGSAQKMISKQALENLEVFVPPIERQKNIMQLASLAEEEQQLMEKILAKRKQYIKTYLIKLAKGEY